LGILIIPVLGRLRQEDHEFQASLSYIGDPDEKVKQTNKQKVSLRRLIRRFSNTVNQEGFPFIGFRTVATVSFSTF
jgi:hypothetical protein